MPELPEVQTVISGINQNLNGQTLEKIDVLDPKLFITLFPLVNLGNWGKLDRARRKGKLIILDFSFGQSILIHLRMTGQLIYHDRQNVTANFGLGHPNKDLGSSLPVKATRAIFYFSSGTLYFNDQRRFGLIEQLASKDLDKHPFIANLGVDALEISSDYLAKLLSGRKISIKAWLLNQCNIAGIGNIYADEGLHFAKIHPGTIASELSIKQIVNLHRGLQNILKQSIKYQGYNYRNYVNIVGNTGSFSKYAKVYDRANLPCKTCKSAIITKIKLASRGTYFCPNCQIP